MVEEEVVEEEEAEHVWISHMAKCRLKRVVRVQGHLRDPLNGNLDAEGEGKRVLNYFDYEELFGKAVKGDSPETELQGCKK